MRSCQSWSTTAWRAVLEASRRAQRLSCKLQTCINNNGCLSASSIMSVHFVVCVWALRGQHAVRMQSVCGQYAATMRLVCRVTQVVCACLLFLPRLIDNVAVLRLFARSVVCSLYLTNLLHVWPSSIFVQVPCRPSCGVQLKVRGVPPNCS